MDGEPINRVTKTMNGNTVYLSDFIKEPFIFL